jgi:hypothetical protein
VLNAFLLSLAVSLCHAEHQGTSIVKLIAAGQPSQNQAVLSAELAKDNQIQGRLFRQESSTAPENYLSVNEFKNQVFAVYLPSLSQYALIKTDDEGYFKIPIPLFAIYQKQYQQTAVVLDQLEIYGLIDQKTNLYDAIERLYELAPLQFDHPLINGFLEQHLPTAFCFVGQHPIKLLTIETTSSRNYAIRSDIDLTYLNTDFHSSTAMLTLLETTAEQRQTILSMDLILRALTLNPLNTLTLISGSPRFFENHLRQKLSIDEVVPDALFLKDFQGVIKTQLLALKPFSLVSALKAQVPYKLLILLEQRAKLLGNTQEILFGDDSEADHITYSLYSRLLEQKLSLTDLALELQKHEVSEAEIKALIKQAKQTLATISTQPDFKAVARIYIHKTNRPNLKAPASEYLVPQMKLHQHESEMILDLRENQLITEGELQFFCQQYLPRLQSKASTLFRQKELLALCSP